MKRKSKAVLKKSIGKRILKKKPARKKPSGKEAIKKNPETKESAGKGRISKRRRRNRLIIIIAAIIITATAATLILLRNEIFRSIPGQITFTVAWNPGSIADDIVRVFADEMDTHVSLINSPGANGTDGANAVFGFERNGENMLSTSLSALVTAESTGFTENSHKDWAAWLCAFSPAVVAVAHDSPYMTVDDLIATVRQSPGRMSCANSGFGTVSFVAAELLSIRLFLEFDHLYYSGSTQAVNALLEGETDFAVLLSADITGQLMSGQIRAIGSFGEVDYTLYNNDTAITVPSIAGLNERLDAVLPFGEYFGVFAPADTQSSSLRGLDSLVSTAVESERFAEFIRNKGLMPVTPDRTGSVPVVNSFCSVVCWILYDAGFLPVNPEMFDIPRT